MRLMWIPLLMIACGDSDDDTASPDGGATDGGSGDAGAADGGSSDGGGGDGGASSDAAIWMVGNGTLAEFPRDAEAIWYDAYDFYEVNGKSVDSDYWKININVFTDVAGTFDCASETASMVYYDEAASQYFARPAAEGSSCTVIIDAAGKDGEPVTGSFTATLVGGTGAVEVTEGHFNVTARAAR